MIKFVGGQTDIMLFNIYYLNFTKVYEIKMMLSNVIKTDQSVEVGNNDNIDAEFLMEKLVPTLKQDQLIHKKFLKILK